MYSEPSRGKRAIFVFGEIGILITEQTKGKLFVLIGCELRPWPLGERYDRAEAPPFLSLMACESGK